MVQIKQSGACYSNKFYFMFFIGSKHFCLENDVTTLEANQFRFYHWVSKRALKRMPERKEAEI